MPGVEEIGARLRLTRREKRLTQKQLGGATGTSQAVIQKIEDGARLRPAMIMEIAEALDVNPAWPQFGEPGARKERPKGISVGPVLPERKSA